MSKYQRRRFWALAILAVIILALLGVQSIVDIILIGAISGLVDRAK